MPNDAAQEEILDVGPDFPEHSAFVAWWRTTANRSRWPMHPTWAQLRVQFAGVRVTAPLDDDKRHLVRGSRYSGKNRVLCRLALGVVKSLEVEDASTTSAALMTLQRWVEKVAEKEVDRITRKCQRYEETHGAVPRWVKRGMGERFGRLEQVEHRVQMLLGVFAAKGVLPLEFKPAHCVVDLLTQHLDDLESESEDKGGVQQLLADHFARVHRVHVPLPAAA